MSQSVREWLPPGAGESAALRRLVGEAVGAWAAKWFVRADATAAGFAAAHGTAPRRACGWRAGGAVATSQSAPETLRLAGLALGADPEPLVLSEADSDLIGRFTAAVAADLAASLEHALGIEPAAADAAAPAEDPFAGDGGLVFTVSDRAERPLLQAAIPAAALVPFLKGAMAPPRKRPAPLARLGRAFEATSVRVEARLGETTLPLGDLAGLAVGDVLILDRPVEDGAELAIARSGRPFAQGAIVPGERAISLLLLPQQREM